MPTTITPTVRAVGAVANGVGAISPGLPAGTIAGDLLVMFLETADETITVAGWTELPTVSPQSVAGATRLTVFYKIAVGGDATTTSDSGDHQIGRIIGITASTFNLVNPIDSSAGGVRDPASTTATVPGPTTTQAQCLVLAASSHDLDTTTAAFSAPTNANLTGITLRINNSTTDGNGGGLGVASGVKATAGAVGNTTMTVTSSVGGMIALAIAPGTAQNDRISQVPVEVVVKSLSGAAVLSQEAVEVIAQNLEPPQSTGYWKLGVIEVPAATGSQAITIPGGEGVTPFGVVFFGANWLEEDTVVTTSGTAVFRGMATMQWDSPGTIVQHSAAMSPGDQHRTLTSAIMNLTTAGSATVLYEAELTSLDVDGFTLDWTTVTAGGYKVVYAALFEVTNCAGHVGIVNGTLASVGFKAGASLLHGCWGSTAQSGNDRSQEWYGGAAYPTGAGANWSAAGMATQTFPTSQSQQMQLYLDHFRPSVLTVTAQHFTGPFLTGSNLKAYPRGVNLEDFVFTGDGTNAGMVMFWDDDDSDTGFATPDAGVGGVVPVSLPFDPGMVVGYSLSDEPRGQGTGGRGAAGLSVIGYDGRGRAFQWGALTDRINPGAIQSFNKIPNVVHDTDVQSFSGELRTRGFDLTTVDADVTPQSWLWHAFGHPPPIPPFQGWLPHIYRLVLP